jgi:hypothetical protein
MPNGLDAAKASPVAASHAGRARASRPVDDLTNDLMLMNDLMDSSP